MEILKNNLCNTKINLRHRFNQPNWMLFNFYKVLRLRKKLTIFILKNKQKV